MSALSISARGGHRRGGLPAPFSAARFRAGNDVCFNGLISPSLPVARRIGRYEVFATPSQNERCLRIWEVEATSRIEVKRTQQTTSLDVANGAESAHTGIAGEGSQSARSRP